MIYLDYAATTQPSEATMDVMKETMLHYPGNPSSLHEPGIKARKRYNEIKKRLAGLTNTHWKTLCFTATATEAINTIIKGTFFKHPEKTILTSTIEHSATINALEFVKRQGGHVVEIPVDNEGFLMIKELKKALNDYDVSLLTLIYANNEIGTIQDIDIIKPLLKIHDVPLHLDMVQAPAHEIIDFEALDIDYASFSAHKFFGPRGIGFLYVRSPERFTPLLHGGKQEHGMRAGTENLAAIAGMWHALEETWEHIEDNERTIKKNARYFLDALSAKGIDYRLNGPDLGTRRLNNVLNIGFKHIDNHELGFALNDEGIHVSTGSACQSEKILPSHVLKAIGTDEAYLHGSIRFSFSEKEDEQTFEKTANVLKRLIESGDYEK